MAIAIVAMAAVTLILASEAPEPVVNRSLPVAVTERPASYVGAIGNCPTVSAALDTTRCRLGEPVRLTLSVSGDFRVEHVDAPTLAALTNAPRHFEVYPGTARRSAAGGRVVCTYVLRPTEAGSIELPPIEVGYYDTLARGYRSVFTRPRPLRVEPDAPEVGWTVESRPRTRIIAALDVDPRGVMAVSFGLRSWHLPVLAGAPLVYLALLGFTGLRSRWKRKAPGRRTLWPGQET